MAIQSNEIKWYRSRIINDGPTNGGTMSAQEIPDGVKNNVWPDVPQAERNTGSVKYRKNFIKIANDDDLALIAPRLFIETGTPGEDRVVLLSATQTDTQNEAVTYSRCYGVGILDSPILANDDTLQVVVEPGNGTDGDAIFQDGDLIRISDQTSLDAPTGNSEFLRLAATDAVSWNSQLATLTLAAGSRPVHSYAAGVTKVASVLEGADIAATTHGWLISSQAGSYDRNGFPLILDHIGSIEQTWNLTFTSTTQFLCVGNDLGIVGGGAIQTDFAPLNPDFDKPYFTLTGGSPPWGGTFASGDTVTFATHPAAIPLWEKRTVPPGASSHSGNQVIVAISGESA
ncbi:MAG: hypothetical protein HQL86_07725 [Magnetococcales bacterium]|nr:hypothetical protein [Magnetococcales bacterium]